MIINAGFDMVPRLTKDAVDRRSWAKFLEFIKEYYKDDDRVEATRNYLLFKAGAEHPKLPFEGHKFLRFSSKVSGGIARATGVEGYIDIVTLVAKRTFGSRVRYWNEARDQRGHYGRGEVNESFRSYEKSDGLEIPTSIAGHVCGRDAIRPPRSEIRLIPGKGKGVMTRSDIAKGTRILIEKPLFVVPNTTPQSLEQAVSSKLKLLSKEQQRKFLSLPNNFPRSSRLGGIAKTNALPCGSGSGSSTGGIYSTISMIKHSCLPNSHGSWNAEKTHATVHATRDIRVGEEITIDYHGEATVSRVRRARLKRAFGFDCACALCSLSPSKLRASDDRRARIERLISAIGDPRRVPDAGLADCRSLLRVLEEEFRDGAAAALICRLYYDAFRIAVAHGDRARAAVFAERAYRAKVVCEGDDSPETVRMKRLVENPAGHADFAGRWESEMESMPQGLDAVRFERWLWRTSPTSNV